MPLRSYFVLHVSRYDRLIRISGNCIILIQNKYSNECKCPRTRSAHLIIGGVNMTFFTRIDADNIKWYFIAPDDYPLEDSDIVISSDKFYEETNRYSLFVKPVKDCEYKIFV